MTETSNQTQSALEEIAEASSAGKRAKAMRNVPGGTTGFLVMEHGIPAEHLSILAGFQDRDDAVTFAQELMRETIDDPNNWSSRYEIMPVRLLPVRTV